MYIKTDIPKIGTNPGRGLKPKSMITLIDVDDIQSFPPRDSKGVLLDGAIVLKPGKYGIKIYATQETVAVNSPSEGEADNEGFVPELKFLHPGNHQLIREFKANMIGKNLIGILDYCNGGRKDLFGSPCEPMRMQVAYSGDKDKNTNEITLKQAVKGNDIAIYEGSVPYAEPLKVVAAGATTIPLEGEGEYQLTGGTTAAAITAATGATHGMMFTLLGAPSGTAPSIAASEKFILKDGAAWTGSAGSQITFQAIKSSASAFTFVEKSRA